MKSLKANRYLIALVISAPLFASAQNSSNFKVTDRFFGVHFDFHANPDTRGIGKTLTVAGVDSMLDMVKPDFIQVDTKGHPGISSYPTAVGVAAPNIVQDPLRLFREETGKRNIGLFSHFSGILDAQAIKDHPDWVRINGDGKPDAGATSIFGKYADNYFIPQINELSSKYHINGIWVDGECWALQPDYSPAAIEAYKKFSGKADAPRSRKDADWPKYVQFTRDAFHQYLTHYINAVHKFNPNLIVTSNWSFSSFMPGKVDAPVDYLSGDFTSDAVPDVDFEARTLAPQGKPWDLMCWGFMSDKNGKGFFWKTARHLEQKAALVLSQDGGYQVYIPQKRDASLQLETIPMLTAVSAFCHERKAYSFNTTPVPQVALLLSEYGHNNESPGVFENGQGGNNNVKGTLAMLLNLQYSVQVLQEHSLKNSLAKYPLLVITEWRSLPSEVITMVEDYAGKGGKVLTIGDGHLFSGMLSGAAVDKTNPAGLPVRTARYGKGTVTNIDDNISLKYLNTQNDTLRQIVAGIVKGLFPEPKVTVSGSSKIHVTINTKDKSTLIHLINVDDHFDTLADNRLEFKLPAITDQLSITVNAPKPRTVKIQPGDIDVPFSYENGFVKFNIPGVDVYSIVQLTN
ncbi:hypothetical protein FO440_05505 [Mucilaginibacter corticis]|uniref:Beta-galactosidase trimerisation domain-containing protein n=1 Tax=Mucilaginibacter corticis TaxID=2597670 RepID=A0A556MUW0_9SPHI|nr:hypothetical protein [Mucilaginibacter corticis]TSJ43645.1 hypothetical protein FO440_05505 [Mucilaginibacter corticis]